MGFTGKWGNEKMKENGKGSPAASGLAGGGWLVIYRQWQYREKIERKKMQIGGREDEEMSGELGWWCWEEHKEGKKNGRKE